MRCSSRRESEPRRVVGSPLHVHHANEERLLVLAGTLALRGPDGTQLLPAGAVAASPGGQAGAHSLVGSVLSVHSDADLSPLM